MPATIELTLAARERVKRVVSELVAAETQFVLAENSLLPPEEAQGALARLSKARAVYARLVGDAEPVRRKHLPTQK